MNIRVYTKSDIPKLIEIWYESSLVAHHFIDDYYWKSQRTAMKEKYLPMSETYVISNEIEVVGFISMVDAYLAALFIDVKHQGKGYGKRLLDFIKTKRDYIQLKVYKKNKHAVNFYLNHRFVIQEQLLDEQTAEVEFLMRWENSI